MPKYPLAKAIDPVTGDGFLKIANIQKMRRYPVTIDQHFAANFRIAGFIRLP